MISTEDLQEVLSNKNLIPTKLGVYYLSKKQDPGDGSLQISYNSDDDGFITITIYNNGEVLNSDINDQRLVDELEQCISAIFQFEEDGIYQNVNLLVKEPFLFEDSDTPIFQSAIFNLQRVDTEGESCHPELSILFLRVDRDYFHKIRFSMPSEGCDETYSNLEFFLRQWLNFINIVGIEVN